MEDWTQFSTTLYLYYFHIKLYSYFKNMFLKISDNCHRDQFYLNMPFMFWPISYKLHSKSST